jgi:glyoxylase-like metal-dependent hydrolase (beta-lactamase superfamily II)
MKSHASNIVLMIWIALLLHAVAFAQTSDDMPIVVQRLSDKAYLFKLAFLQTSVLVSERGLVVLDANRGPAAGAALRDRIVEELGRDDFAYLINTHHHDDHTGGHAAFSDLTIVGHERLSEGLNNEVDRDFSSNADRYRQIANNFREELESVEPDSDSGVLIRGNINYLLSTATDYDSGFVLVPPEISFNDRLTLDLGDLTLEMSDFGHAHSISDILIFVSEERLLFMGDLYAGGRVPWFPDETELAVPQWLASLDAVLDRAQDIELIVSGHIGDDMTVEQWRERREYIAALWEGVPAAMNEGLTLAEVQARLALERVYPKFLDIKYIFSGDENAHEHNVEMVWNHFANR